MLLFCGPGINHTVFGNYKEETILISLVSLALLKIIRESIYCFHFKRVWTVSVVNIIQHSLEKFQSQPESLQGLLLQYSLSALSQIEASAF